MASVPNPISDIQNTVFYRFYYTADGFDDVPADTFFVVRYGADGIATNRFILIDELGVYSVSGTASDNATVRFSVDFNLKGVYLDYSIVGYDDSFKLDVICDYDFLVSFYAKKRSLQNLNNI